MTTNILVTGGAGYIGSVLVPELLCAGHRVTVIDNFMYRQNSLAACCSDSNFDVINGDVRDEALMRDHVSRADVIIPLAAIVGAPACDRDPVAATTVNRDAVLFMLGILSSQQRVLMPITNSGYGIGEKGKHCTEKTPLRPVSRYGRDKVEAEQAALELGNAISFRLATVFGMSPRMRVDLLVNDFVHRAITDRFLVLFEGHFRRNFLHVRDVARVFLHGLENFVSLQGEPYNVGLSDANLSRLELCERIKKQLPDFIYMEAPIGEDPDKRDYIVSNAKIEATGFVPAHSLDKGIAELIKGCRMIQNSVYINP